MGRKIAGPGRELRNVAEKIRESKIYSLEMIPLHKIVANQDSRETFDMEDISQLSKAIEDCGFYTVIQVFQRRDGNYELLCGDRRCEAAKQAGFKEIPAIVLDSNMPEDKKLKIMMNDNMQGRKNLRNPVTMCKVIALQEKILKMEKYQGNIRDELASRLNVSSRQISRYKKMGDLNDTLQKFVTKGLVNFSTALMLAELSKEEQEEYSNALNEKDFSFLLANEEAESKIAANTIEQVRKKLEKKEIKPKATLEDRAYKAMTNVTKILSRKNFSYQDPKQMRSQLETLKNSIDEMLKKMDAQEEGNQDDEHGSDIGAV